MKEDSIYFDTSYYSKDHFLHSNESVRQMKGKCAGTFVKEIVDLGLKMYSLLYGKKEKKNIYYELIKSLKNGSFTS